MTRVSLAILLSLWLYLIGYLSYGFDESLYLFESWFCSFSLPIWSILTIGLWYDVGRMMLGDWNTSKIWDKLQPVTFIFWMSLVFTYVAWIHINLAVVHMMILIPFISIPLREWLVKDWSNIELPSKRELLALVFWFICSYMTYWVLSILWIVFRVKLFELTTDGLVYFIQ